MLIIFGRLPGSGRLHNSQNGVSFGVD